MFLLNVEGWFRDPLLWYQLIFRMLLITSLVLVIQSLRLLRTIGQWGGGARMQRCWSWKKHLAW